MSSLRPTGDATWSQTVWCQTVNPPSNWRRDVGPDGLVSDCQPSIQLAARRGARRSGVRLSTLHPTVGETWGQTDGLVSDCQPYVQPSTSRRPVHGWMSDCQPSDQLTGRNVRQNRRSGVRLPALSRRRPVHGWISDRQPSVRLTCGRPADGRQVGLQ